MSTLILQTKLYVPATTKGRVFRPRLLRCLNAGLQAGHRLILVSAPAGFGKTTLIADWINQSSNLPVPSIADRLAWVALDTNDNDLTRFLAYLISALQQIDSVLGEDTLNILQSSQPPPTESVLTALLNQIASLPGQFIIVLDDYHLIVDQLIHRAVTFLIEHLPPQVHFVIITRADPPLPIARFRARGQMTEVREAALRFNMEEITSFLNHVMELDLSNDHIRSLGARTEGWITGLQMAALSLKGKTDIEAFITAFSGSHRFILDYLTEEVIQGQPDDLQEFILQTAILDRLSGPLCEAVTGRVGSRETLQRLEEVNLFLIPLDDERVWFRYHHLFADVMANRLRRFYPDRLPELHLRAAKWFQQNHFFGEAIEHALAATDYLLAADIVEGQALDLLKLGSLSTLKGWLERLPPEIVHTRPKLGVDSAWVYLNIGKLERIEDFLTPAETNLDGLDNADELRGQIAAIRAFAAARLEDLDRAIDQAHVALELLAADDLAVRCVVAYALGGVYYVQQNIPRALATLKEASQLGEQAGNIHVAVGALSAIGGTLEQQGNLAESEEAFYRALQIGTGRGGRPLPITAGVYSGLARLRLVQKDRVSARQFALTGLELAEKMVSADNQVYCYLTLAQVEHLEGNSDEARAVLENVKRLAATHDLWPGAQEQITACETAILAAPAKRVDQGLLIDPLSERELEVLRLLAAGSSNRSIADELVIALGTVKAHTASIYGKLGVRSRTQAVARAREVGLL